MKKKIYLIPLILLLIILSSCFGNKCDHEYGEWKIRFYPKYYEKGTFYRTCNLCLDEETDEIPHLGEEIWYKVEVISESTCNAEGKARFTYLEEGRSFVMEGDLPRTDHTFTSFTLDEENEKYHKGQCSVCNGVISISHEFTSLLGEESTCQTQGYSNGEICKVCNYKKGVTYYELRDHNYVDGVCQWCNTDRLVTVKYVLSEEEEIVVDVKYESNFNNLEQESSEEKTFMGWYTEDGKKVDNDYVLTNNLVVYAKYFENVLIKTKEDFLAIKNAPSKSYILKNDIDLDGLVITPFDSFNGNLNGNGYSISNFTLKITTPTDVYGMFKVNKGTIQNITFTDFVVNYKVDTTITQELGAIIGKNEGVIENVNIVNPNVLIDINIKNKNDITNNIGVLVARNYGNINNCVVDGNINLNTKLFSFGTYGIKDKVYYNIGGLVGANDGKISSSASNIKINSHSISEVGAAENYGKSYSHVYTRIGGLVGINQNKGEIAKSYTNTNLSYTHNTINSTDGESYNYLYMGGIAGSNLSSATISECYSNDSLKGGAKTLTHVGGLVGHNDDNAQINSNYSSTIIESGNQSIGGAYYGGLVGYNNSSIRNSYSNGQVVSSVTSSNGGLVGTNETAGVIVKSYSNSIVNSSEGRSGEFTAISKGIIEKSYYVSNQKYYPGNTDKPQFNDSSSVNAINVIDLVEKSFLQNTLSFNDSWEISGFNHPILKWEINSNLHNFEEYIVDATCTEDGYKCLYCEHCDIVVITEEIQATGHERIDDKVYGSLLPTHFEDGYEIYLCSKTHKDQINGNYNYYEVVIEALGHNVPEVINCEDVNLIYDEIEDEYYYLCDCDNIYITEAFRCHIEDKTRVIHKEVEAKAVSPECEGEKLGYTSGTKCELCNVVLSGCDPIQPHYYKYVETTKEATCTELGEVLYKCSLCDVEKCETISVIPHKYENNSLSCSICNVERYTIDDSYIAISSVDDLKNIIKNPSKNYYLAEDISLKDYENLILDFEFNGVFHGNGKTISNLVYNYSNKENLQSGLFKTIGENGVIIGLTLKDVSVKLSNVSKANVGVLACENYGTITNCTITSSNGNSNKFINNTEVVSSNLNSVTKNYNYVIGLVTAINFGNIDYLNILGNISIDNKFTSKYNANFNGLSNLGKSATVTNNSILKFGAITAINNGTIFYSIMNAGVVSTSNYESDVDGTGFGKTYTNVELYCGAFIGVNSGEVIDSKSIDLYKNNFHDKTVDCYSNSYGLDSHLETIKIKDYTVFETLEGVIGHSSNELDTEIEILSK